VSRRGSLFTELVNAEKATAVDSQLSTTQASQPATTSPSPRPTITERPLAALSTIPRAAEVASQPATEHASQLPPPSTLPTAAPEPASRQAIRRKVDSHRNKRVDSRKGDRHTSDKVPFNNRLSADVVRQLKHFCIEHGMEQQEFAELAAIHFMEYVDSHQQQPVDSTLASDERDLMILFKTNPSIINVYIQYNPENRWKPADDAEGKRYNTADLRLVEFGIIQTQFNARFKKIHSFKYYTTEIDIAIETPLASDTIDIMLKHSRRRWQDATAQK
jgi:hypothetical protein